MVNFTLTQIKELIKNKKVVVLTEKKPDDQFSESRICYATPITYDFLKIRLQIGTVGFVKYKNKKTGICFICGAISYFNKKNKRKKIFLTPSKCNWLYYEKCNWNPLRFRVLKISSSKNNWRLAVKKYG